MNKKIANALNSIEIEKKTVSLPPAPWDKK